MEQKCKILCAGMRRSGSTWLFNVLRVCLSDSHDVYANFYDQFAHNGCPVTLLKTHRYDYLLAFCADMVFLSYRDLRDVAASAVRYGQIRQITPPEVVRFLHRATVEEFDRWMPRGDHMVKYEDMVANPPAEVAKIASALGVAIDPEKVAAMVDALPIGIVMDAETQLHPNHRTDGRVGSYSDTLPPDCIAAIEATFGDWLREYGYA